MKERNMKPAIRYGLLLVFATLSATAGAQPSTGAQAPSGDTQRAPNSDFVRLDTNKDGFVSRNEAAKDKTISRNFSKFDENKDGKLTEDEFTKLQSTAARGKAVAYVDDSTLTTKVKAALLTAKGMKSTDISVETTKGVVTLSGAVEKAGQIKRAGAIAAKVKGVKKVENKLTAK
jgi:HSP20 family molecular chaperone IbpA